MKRLNMSEFETSLREHGARMKKNTAIPYRKEWTALLETDLVVPAKTFAAKRRIPFIAIAAAFLLGITALAAGGFVSGWFSGHAETYEELNARQYARKEGYEPIHIQSFSNGYSYSRGYVVTNQINDADLGEVDTFQSTTFEYQKGGYQLLFTQERSEFPVNKFGSLFETHSGIELWYYSYTNKFVPEGYEPSESDKAAEAEGKLILTYGPDEISMVTVSSLSWCKDGINYNLMQMDGELSAEELCVMAKEIIDR